MADTATPVNTAAATRGLDILVRTAPPLSAVVDSPLGEIAKPPPSASNDPGDIAKGVAPEMSPQDQAAARAAKVTDSDPAEPDADAKVTDPEATEVKAADGEEVETIEVDGKQVSLPPWMKREITKARNRQREAEAAAKTAAEQLAEVKAKVDELTTKVEQKPEPVKAEEDPRPTRDRFDDPDAYDEALTAWAEREGGRKAHIKLTAERQAAEQEAAAKQAAAEQAAQEADTIRRKADWDTKVAKAVEKHADYIEVTTSDALQITPLMAARITEIANGTDVAYWLGQNPEEAARIATLRSPADQVHEMALLSARISAPAARAPRSRPLDPVSTASGRADSSQREPSMEEWGARRTTEILGRRRPFMEPSEQMRARA